MKLWVFGCSASDRTEVDSCYGDYLSAELGIEYKHYAVGCGSNDRIFRILPTLVKNNKISSDDIVIVQYTEETRTEFYSGYNTDLPLRDVYNKGQILRYKANSHSWQPNKTEQKFFKLYEKYFLDVEFANEKFAAQNYALQNVFFANNINAWFLNIHGYTPKSFESIEIFNDKIITIDKLECKQWFFDDGHFDTQGHKKVAKKVKKRLTFV